MAVIGVLLQLLSLPTAAHWILGIAAIIACFPLLANMWRAFSAGSYGIELLALVSIVTAVALRQFWAAIIVVLLLTLSEVVESFVSQRVKVEVDALLKHMPHEAHLLRGGKVQAVAAAKVQPNDRLLIQPGETVPVDGTIIAGESSFDTSRLTGEPLPEMLGIGHAVLSGSVNTGTEVTIRATAAAAQSQYQRLVQLAKTAASSQAPFIRLADRYSIPFTLFALLLGIGLWVVSGQAIRFLEVVIVATPTPLLLAAPIAIMSGISRAARYGIIIRTGTALEHLSNVHTMAFNKTGTLTGGTPAVAEVATYDKHTPKEVLGLAAALEASSTHVLAKAITDAASSQGIKIPKAKHVSESRSHGVTAVVGGTKVFVGRMSLLETHGIALPPSFAAKAQKHTVAYVAIDGELAGIISFNDAVRPETSNALESLKQLGVRHFMIITGDNEQAAHATAKQLGITDITADALPATKLHTLEAVHNRPVAFVGDGIADAPVLTTADIGIALGARSATAATESCDIAIMSHDLGLVPVAVKIAKRSMRIARRSTLAGLVLTLILIAIFATGKFAPIYGALFQEVIDLLVIIVAMQAHANR